MTKLKALLERVDWKEVSPAVWARYIVGIVATVNMILTTLNLNPLPFSEDEVYIVISAILQLVVLVVNTYMNNSTSKEAITADAVLNLLKNGTVEISDMLTKLDQLQKIKDTTTTTETETTTENEP